MTAVPQVKRARIGIDVGGTFTDFVLAVEGTGELEYHKEPSTPHEPSSAVLNGISHLLATHDMRPEQITSISHGTTIGLNAIIQRGGANIAVVISRGHRDVLELARRQANDYDFRQESSKPLVSRDRVLEIGARLNSAGEILDTPDDAEISRIADELSTLGAESVALTVLHSYLNPEFEADIARRIEQQLDGVRVVASSAIWPEIREYNRTSVVALNSYITPLMDRYLATLQAGLEALDIMAPLYITASNGGSLGVAAALERPVDTILSGPASGVTATLRLAQDNDLANVVSFDMGGTSSDIAVAQTGIAEFANRTEVGGLPLIMPVIDVNAIGAGGGSVAYVDAQGLLQVGPESTGAVPGPAAYGLGGDRPTVTDAYVTTGIVDAATFLGGAKPLRADLAEQAIETIADGLELVGEDRAARAAASVLTIATIGMASELTKVLARRGFEAHEFTLVPFGGAGPTHASLLAEELGIRRIVVPLAASTYCALGALEADLRRDFLRGVGRELDDSIAHLASGYATELLRIGNEWVTEQGDLAEETVVEAFFETRYLGQAFEIDVPINAADLPLSREQITERFHHAHEAAFGHRDLSSPVNIISVKVSAYGRVANVAVGDLPVTPANGIDTEPRYRDVYVAGRWQQARVLGIEDLSQSLNVQGPAVLDLHNTTVLIAEHWTLRAGAASSLIIERIAA